MNIQRLKEHGIDYEDGLRRFSGHSAIYEKYIKRLYQLDFYEDLKTSLEKKDVQGAFESAHKLKTFIGNLSIPILFQEISQLTDILRSGTLEGTEEAMIDIDDRFTDLESVIQQEIEEEEN